MIAQEEGGLHHEERGCGNVCSNTGNCQPLGFIAKYSTEPYIGCYMGINVKHCGYAPQKKWIGYLEIANYKSVVV